ncbi:MAG: hypothetical protein RLZZ67_686 [Candidatus Parcubacteria bacterium]
MLRKSKISIEWSLQFAYAIGLIVSDGNLSKDGRHLNFTSKDLDLILTFKKCLNLSNSIGIKGRGENMLCKKYYFIQFGDRNFYQFLNSIGIYSAKSRTIRSVKVPDLYFKDFLRGCIDGDGCISTYKHKESAHKQLKVRLYSGSFLFLSYILLKTSKLVQTKGGSITKGKGAYVLSWGKADAVKILNFMYYDKQSFYLKRKFAQANIWADGGIGRHTTLRR